MSRPRRKKRTRTRPSNATGQRVKHGPKNHRPLQIPDDTVRDKYFEKFVIILLLGFGIYISVLYFGHQVVPNSDFTAFVGVAKQLLDFKVPSSFKRVPMLGLLQVGLSKLVGGQHPELTAGWLLNAILYPINLILLYLLSRKVLGKPAIWFALIAIINPWTIKLMVQPIAETTLTFFILLTFYFMLRRSRWCYLFACITTMVRYEGVVLIMAAFLWDMIDSKTKRERIMAFVYSAMASVPVAIWMLGTRLTWKSSQSHYIHHYTGSKNSLSYFPSNLWQVSVGSLFRTTTEASLQTMASISKTVLVASLIIALVYCLYKRRWDVAALFFFLGFYFFIHALRANAHYRYCVPASWLILLLCFYGIQSMWRLINGSNRIPRPMVIIMQVVVLIVAGIWMIILMPMLPKLAPYSKTSVSLPYVAMGLIGLHCMAQAVVYRTRGLLYAMTFSVLACLMIVSSHFMLVRQVGNGNGDKEFKLLADWYVENAAPGEKMVTSLPHVVTLFAPDYTNNFIKTSRVGGKDTQGFIAACVERNITYIAWDSRIGFMPNNSYYRRWRIGRIAPLIEPAGGRSLGLEFLQQIGVSNRRFINIFRLRKPNLPARPTATKTENKN